MKTKTVKLFWAANPMEIGGVIRGQWVHRNLFEDMSGCFWEIKSAFATGQERTMVLQRDEDIALVSIKEYEVTMQLCTERELTSFIQEEILRN